MKLTRRILFLLLLVPLLVGAQAPTQEEKEKFAAIKARHDRGEQVTPEEQQFAQRFMQRPNQAQLQGLSDADKQRFAQIRAKRERGEQLTPEEQQFAQRIMNAQQGNQANAAKRFEEYAKTHPPRESTGLVPLPELGKKNYQGEQGGLYPGGENVPPPAHLKAGQAIAQRIVPLNAEGAKSEDGKIVLLTIGMSNTTMESQAFLKLAAADTQLNPRLALVDGAQGGQTAKVTANPQANYWKVADERLSAAGVTGKQVQVVWLKQANAQPTEPFPTEAKKLQADIIETLHNLSARFPNLKMAYLSNRIYAGYAASALNPEPHSYEGGFGVKWVIADQIAGKPELNYDPAKGQVRSPWLAWGPYLWADGMKARKDGLIYVRDDLGPDGTHPSRPGQEKVARQLLDFLKNDPTSRPWFVK